MANTYCTDCRSELNVLLCNIPSMWREQIVEVLCNTISTYAADCSKVIECLNNELDTLDYECLAESTSEWKSYNLLQKLQVMITKICEGLESSNPQLEIESSSLIVTPGGDLGHNPTVEVGISTDEGNIIEIGEDGYIFASAQTGPDITVNDSSSINFTASGTQNHTITASVIIDPVEGNALTVSGSGLLVDPDQFQTPLTFDNGIYLDGDIVKLGTNPLVENTEIQTDGFDFTIQQAQAYLKYEDDEINAITRKDNTTAVFLNTDYSRVIEHLSNYSEGTTSSFYTKGYRKINSTESTVGFHIPEGSSPGALVPTKSAYFKATETNLELYANKTTRTAVNNSISSGTLVSGRRYEILTAGGTFTSSGAANNAVGTVFVANSTPPAWSTGSVKLIGEHRDIVNGDHGTNTTFQDDFTWYNQIIDTDTDLVSVVYNRADLYVNSIVDYTDYLTNSFYTFGQVAINSTDGTMATAYARIGHYVPDSNDSGSPAPTIDADYTSMSTYSRGAITNYAKKIVNEGVTVVAHQGASAAPHSSAIMEVQSTTKGFLLPKMTAAQRSAISSPTAGLIVYQTDGLVTERGIWAYDSGSASWKRINWT